jgi:hypothetical protein
MRRPSRKRYGLAAKEEEALISAIASTVKKLSKASSVP